MAISVAVLLLFVAPLMRGGNRQVALLVLESIALAFLLSIWLRSVFADRDRPVPRELSSVRKLLVAFLLLSPAWLALIYLAPVPAEFWASLPGHSTYQALSAAAGLPAPTARPLSLAPDSTRVSLLAGIPLMAGFLAGYTCRPAQLRWLLGTVVVVAFLQVILGLLQIAGGTQSSLYFGMNTDRPIGTFANPNHFANYLGMALVAYIWLAWNNLVAASSRRRDHSSIKFTHRHATALWIAGGVALVLGILLSRSRGAAFSGLPIGMLALGLALSAGGKAQGWRASLGLGAGITVGAVALVGLGAVISRFELGGLAESAFYRGLLASTTLDGAAVFWPWGTGWGTYAAVYPRFQPLEISGFADYAHHDYAQMLFEGGVFAVLLGAAFCWLAISRAVELARSALRRRALERDEMTCALCGLGLLGLLLHSLVEFNMHIPANAIVGALLAGAYLRPLASGNAAQ